MTQNGRPPTWREMNMDTSPEAEAVLFELLREMPGWRKWQMMDDMNRTVRELAMAGIRQRHPSADEEEVKRRLVDILLGEELAAKVYGPLSE